MYSKSITAALMGNQPMESIIDTNYISYIISRQIFCAVSKPSVILDERTAIVIEVYKDNTMLKASAISPKLAGKLEELKEQVGKKGLTVKFLTNNKEVQLPESSYKPTEGNS